MPEDSGKFAEKISVYVAPGGQAFISDRLYDYFGKAIA